MDDFENTQLKDYHNQLEKITEYVSLLSLKDFHWDQSSPELRLKLSIEQSALSRINADHINEVFHAQKEEVEIYLKIRLETSGNALLRAKYNHFLYALKKITKMVKMQFEDINKH